jgi:uncharacterized protein YraI
MFHNEKRFISISTNCFNSPAYAGACLNKNTSPVEKVTKASSIKVSNVKLRSGSGIKYCKLREVNNAKNKPVTIKGKSGSWRQIIFDGEDYWIHGNLLNILNGNDLKGGNSLDKQGRDPLAKEDRA